MKLDFSKLISFLESQEAPVLKTLLPGVIESDIRNFIGTQFNFKTNNIPQPLVELYMTCGGTQLISTGDFPKMHLFPIYMFNSFEYINIVIDTQDDIYNFRRKAMFPLFSSGYGEHLAISLNELNKGENSAPIYYTSAGDSSRQGYTIIYDNFHTMMETIRKCYLEKYYFFDRNQNSEEDFKNAWQLSKSMNKKAKFWY